MVDRKEISNAFSSSRGIDQLYLKILGAYGSVHARNQSQVHSDFVEYPLPICHYRVLARDAIFALAAFTREKLAVLPQNLSKQAEPNSAITQMQTTFLRSSPAPLPTIAVVFHAIADEKCQRSVAMATPSMCGSTGLAGHNRAACWDIWSMATEWLIFGPQCWDLS